jgi:hypothetical protein
MIRRLAVNPGFARTYHVELLYREKPVFNARKLHSLLRRNCGNIDLNSSPTQHGESLHIIHLDHRVQYTEGAVPSQTMIIPSEKLAKESVYAEALQQSWSWRDASQVLPQCHFSIGVMDLMASGLDYKVRLTVIHQVLKSLIEAAPCAAMHWQMAQQLIEPQAYLEAQSGEKPDLMFAAFNVRLFNIQNRAPGETLMDTLGLAALGLSDLQCHFVNLDPNDIARILFNTGHYIFERGDVINDGETVQGIQPSDKWKCQHEAALVAPEREVLDINPGASYAAGTR